MKRIITNGLLIIAAAVFIFGCSKKDDSKLKVGATPVPHAEILKLIKDDLKKDGVELEIVEFTDYVTPNIALNDKQIDANFFQHLPYLESFIRERNMQLASLAGIHVEPLGLYSEKISSFDKLPDGAVIAIPNDPTNEGRALLLLQANGLIKLDEKAGLEGTPVNIIENPKKLKFRELEAAQLPRVLNDVDAAVINGNYAIEAKLNPIEDALILEGAESPYVNIIAIRKGTENDDKLQKLVKALQSEKVKEFILNNYNGGVVPVF